MSRDVASLWPPKFVESTTLPSAVHVIVNEKRPIIANEVLSHAAEPPQSEISQGIPIESELIESEMLIESEWFGG